MRLCTWRRGSCAVTVPSDVDLCAYHDKVAAGLIVSTRGESNLDVHALDLTPIERAAAESAWSDYWQRQERAEQERRAQDRREREAAWTRGLGD